MAVPLTFDGYRRAKHCAGFIGTTRPDSAVGMNNLTFSSASICGAVRNTDCLLRACPSGGLTGCVSDILIVITTTRRPSNCLCASHAVGPGRPRR